MTREEMLAMEPGRTLDAMVAKYVMFPRHSDPLKEVSKWCRKYSTEISVAWEVVEKFKRGSNWMLYRLAHNDASGNVDYDCTFLEVNRGTSAYAICETAPEAICKAALLAVLGL